MAELTARLRDFWRQTRILADAAAYCLTTRPPYRPSRREIMRHAWNCRNTRGM